MNPERSDWTRKPWLKFCDICGHEFENSNERAPRPGFPFAHQCRDGVTCAQRFVRYISKPGNLGDNMEPQRPSDPCYYWKDFELQRVAAKMRAGLRALPVLKFSDEEKVSIAFELQRRYDVTVWINAGQLSYRFGLQGPRWKLAWRDAALLTDCLPAGAAVILTKRKQVQRVESIRRRMKTA